MPRVLIADDEEFVRYYLRNLVLNMHWEVAEETGTGKGLFKLICKTKPDILFLDMNMPDVNGYDFLCQYGEVLKTTVCTIILTISASDSIQKDLAARGYNYFLRKNIDPKKISKYIKIYWADFLRKNR